MKAKSKRVNCDCWLHYRTSAYRYIYILTHVLIASMGLGGSILHSLDSVHFVSTCGYETKNKKDIMIPSIYKLLASYPISCIIELSGHTFCKK